MFQFALAMRVAAIFIFNTWSFAACHNHAKPENWNDSTPDFGNGFGSLHQSYYPPNADCVDHLIPVDIVSDNHIFNYTHWKSGDGFEDFLTIATTRPNVGYPSVFEGVKSENATYQIAASVCSPKKNRNENTLLLATHGIGPGRTHWNSPFRPDEYNFVQYVVDQGDSVFFYDRLGCGASQKISGYKNQISISIAILQRLADLVRSGTYTGSVGNPRKVALIGFSYGSYTTHNAIAARPEIADAVILMGIGFIQLASILMNPHLYGDHDTGYVTWADKFAQIYNYFKKPKYDILSVDFAEYAKVPFAITEFLTLASELSAPKSANYTGPVLAISGSKDYVFCDGECEGIFDEPADTIYRSAKPSKKVLLPGISHNVNLHHNATGAYKAIINFLKNSGL